MIQRFTSAALIAIIVMSAATTGDALAQTVRMAVIGDSNVAGTAVGWTEHYPAQLERALKAKGFDVSVLNSGRNGDTTGGVLARLESGVPAGTKVAVVWVGVNDRRNGASPQEIQQGRQAIAARLRERGVEVYVIGPSVYNRDMHDNDAWIVPDGHFNAAGYSMMVSKTLAPIQALVTRARRKGS